MPTPLIEGMKLKIVKGDAPDKMDPNWHTGINWIAGRVPIGAIGIVSKTLIGWKIDFPDHPISPEMIERKFHRAIMDPMGDQFEVVV